MSNRFVVKEWAAFAAGLGTREEWLAWAASPFRPVGEARPELVELPPMQRRRVGTLGRMALQVALWCRPAPVDSMPLLFVSRHGDLSRTHEMLLAMAGGEAVSPTNFGLSTHNAIAAQFSIACGFRGNYLSLCAGKSGPEAGVVEATALLADGAENVLLVVYDDPVPAPYRDFIDEPEAAFSWAAVLTKPSSGEPSFELDVGPAPEDARDFDPAGLPHALEVLRFLIGDADELAHVASGRRWLWRRHA